MSLPVQRLTRGLLRQTLCLPPGLAHGPLADYPEKVMFFGSGAFLRAFAAWMVDIANEKRVFAGGIVVVQSTPRGTVQTINEQEGLYTVLLRGVQSGEVVQSIRIVTAVRRGIDAVGQWEELTRSFRNPALRWVISNTTEAGIVYLAERHRPGICPDSFPAKVASLLYARFEHFHGDPAKGLVFLPCELIEGNGHKLRQAVLWHAEAWDFGCEFSDWVRASNCFLNTMVDRIVCGYPCDEASGLTKMLGYEDQLLDAGEDFHLWVIEGPQDLAEEFPLHKAGLNVVWTSDLGPYRTRKVRILNGAHTATALAAFQAGLNTIVEMVEDPICGPFLRKVLFEEIVPTVALAEEDRSSYAETVLERFRNPFTKHELLSIALNSVSKWKVRVLPCLLDFLRQSQHLPPAVIFSLAALIHFYRGTDSGSGEMRGTRGGADYPIRDEKSVLAFFQQAWNSFAARGSVKELAVSVLAEQTLWGTDLAAVPELADAVARGLEAILTHGARSAMQAILQTAAPAT